MFNCYLYEKKLQEKKQIDLQKKQYLENKEKQKEKNDKYAEQYKKRVENFVVNMMEAPQVITDYQGPSIFKLRPDEPDKFISDAQIYVKGFKRERDRIKMAQDQNNNLLFEPCISIKNHDFRERETKKEIQPEMRYASYKTSLDKLQAYVRDNFMNEVENEDFRTQNMALRKQKLQDSLPDTLTVQEKKAFLAQEIAKNVMPTLHNKTHFKAATDMYNRTPMCLTDKAIYKKKIDYHNNQKKPSHVRSVSVLKKQVSSNNMNISNILGDLQEDKNDQRIRNQKTVTINEAGESNHDLVLEGENQTTYSNNNGNTPNQNNTLQSVGAQSITQISRTDKIAKKNQILEGFNSAESSKHILESCNYMKKRDPKAKTLLSGQGHLISAQDKTVSQVYSDIYKSKLNYSQSTRSQTNIFQSQISTVD